MTRKIKQGEMAKEQQDRVAEQLAQLFFEHWQNRRKEKSSPPDRHRH